MPSPLAPSLEEAPAEGPTVRLQFVSTATVPVNTSDLTVRLSRLLNMSASLVTVDDGLTVYVQTVSTAAGVDAQARQIAHTLASTPLAVLHQELAFPLDQPVLVSFNWNIRVVLPPGACLEPRIVATLHVAFTPSPLNLSDVQLRLAAALRVPAEHVAVDEAASSPASNGSTLTAMIDVALPGCELSTESVLQQLNLKLNWLSRSPQLLSPLLGVMLLEHASLEPVLHVVLLSPPPAPRVPPLVEDVTIEGQRTGESGVNAAISAASLLLVACACLFWRRHVRREAAHLVDVDTDRRFQLAHRTTRWLPKEEYACVSRTAIRLCAIAAHLAIRVCGIPA